MAGSWPSDAAAVDTGTPCWAIRLAAVRRSTLGVTLLGRPDFLMAGCHTLWRQFESRTRVPVGVEKTRGA